MLVQETLQMIVNLQFHSGGTGVAEYTDGKLANLPPCRVDQNLDVARSAVSRQHTGNLQIRRRFARGLDGDLRDRTHGKTHFHHHNSDRYMRSRRVAIRRRRRIYVRVTG